MAVLDKKQIQKLKKNAYLQKLQNIPSVAEEDLFLTEKLYLASLLRECMDEHTNHIEGFDEKDRNVTPYQDFTIEILQWLIFRDIIVPCASNYIGNFQEKENGHISYHVCHVEYRINVHSQDGDRQALLHRLMHPEPSPYLEDPEFCYEFWKKIAFYEAMQYLTFKMQSGCFKFSPDSKTETVLRNLVKHFSVGQIYYIIYRAVTSSVDKYLSNKITQRNAQNIVISYCETLGERAIANHWEIKNFSRKKLHQSQISKVFFDSILQISELGFLEKPTSRL